MRNHGRGWTKAGMPPVPAAIRTHLRCVPGQSKFCRGGTVTTIRVDCATHARFEALARTVHRPMADIVATLSYADHQVLLELHARRALAERPPAGRITAGS